MAVKYRFDIIKYPNRFVQTYTIVFQAYESYSDLCF